MALENQNEYLSPSELFGLSFPVCGKAVILELLGLPVETRPRAQRWEHSRYAMYWFWFLSFFLLRFFDVGRF